MRARLLEQRCGAECSTTVFEASHRIGGKLHTRKFSKADAAYESGVAECYGYGGGNDPPTGRRCRRTGNSASEYS